MDNDKKTEKTEEKKPEVKLRDLTPEKDAKGGNPGGPAVDRPGNYGQPLPVDPATGSRQKN